MLHVLPANHRVVRARMFEEPSLLQKLVMEVGQLSFTGSLDPASGLCRRLGSEVLRQLIEAGCPDPQLCHTHEARERGQRERESLCKKL